MADSPQKLIVDNLVTVLKAIKVVNGYKTDISDVQLEALDWATARQKYSLPMMGVIPAMTRFEHVANGIIVAHQDVHIEFIYQAPDLATTYNTGDAIIDDVIGAIYADPTRGGNALHTTIVSAQTDAGNPDLQDSYGGTAAGLITLDIHLSRGWNVS